MKDSSCHAISALVHVGVASVHRESFRTFPPSKAAFAWMEVHIPSPYHLEGA